MLIQRRSMTSINKVTVKKTLAQNTLYMQGWIRTRNRIQKPDTGVGVVFVAAFCCNCSFWRHAVSENIMLQTKWSRWLIGEWHHSYINLGFKGEHKSVLSQSKAKPPLNVSFVPIALKCTLVVWSIVCGDGLAVVLMILRSHFAYLFTIRPHSQRRAPFPMSTHHTWEAMFWIWDTEMDTG